MALSDYRDLPLNAAFCVEIRVFLAVTLNGHLCRYLEPRIVFLLTESDCIAIDVTCARFDAAGFD